MTFLEQCQLRQKALDMAFGLMAQGLANGIPNDMSPDVLVEWASGIEEYLKGEKEEGE